MKKLLVIVDPQNDFVTGSLAIENANKDMNILTNYIKKSNDIDSILVTLDTHNRYHIAHKLWWINKYGEHPKDFTIISKEDVENEIWNSTDYMYTEHALHYVRQLEKNGKFNLVIWPDHCILGTEGHDVVKVLKNELDNWEDKTGEKVNYYQKGYYPFTEFYSALKAEVELAINKDTALNMEMVNQWNTFDKIEFAGEASSHCVANTVLDFVSNIPSECAKKITLLTNCMSAVKGFEDQEKILFDKLKEKGVNFKEI